MGICGDCHMPAALRLGHTIQQMSLYRVAITTSNDFVLLTF